MTIEKFVAKYHAFLSPVVPKEEWEADLCNLATYYSLQGGLNEFMLDEGQKFAQVDIEKEREYRDH